jgi:hypothetical protein
MDRGLYHLENRIGIIPVTVSQWNLFYWIVCKTFTSDNSHLFASLCHCDLQWSRNVRLEVCNSDESLAYTLIPTFGDFWWQIKVGRARKASQRACPRFMSVVCATRCRWGHARAFSWWLVKLLVHVLLMIHNVSQQLLLVGSRALTSLWSVL